MFGWLKRKGGKGKKKKGGVWAGVAPPTSSPHPGQVVPLEQFNSAQYKKWLDDALAKQHLAQMQQNARQNWTPSSWSSTSSVGGIAPFPTQGSPQCSPSECPPDNSPRFPQDPSKAIDAYSDVVEAGETIREMRKAWEEGEGM